MSAKATTTITIEASTPAACEEAVLAMANDIRDRRLLKEQGCVCDLSAPKMRGNSFSVPNRCHDDVTVCLPRRERAGRTMSTIDNRYPGGHPS